MIFTDGTHLATDGDLNELHDFAESIGLKRHYYHGVRKGHPHYDLLNRIRLRDAIAKGAIYVTTKELIERCYDRTRRT
jgi:hypothetical protein